MTDAERVLALLRREAPMAALAAVVDRMQARHRDSPSDAVLAASVDLGQAALWCRASDDAAAWRQLRAAADRVVVACIVSKEHAG